LGERTTISVESK